MAITLIDPTYTCTQAELYAIIKLAIKNYKDNLGVFTAHKTKYDLAFGDDILTRNDAAKALPSKEQRDQDSETFRGHLVTLGKKCLDNWNILESYIKDVYEGTDLKPALQAAGSKEYDKLADKNWEHGVLMNDAAKQFMTDNLTVLLDGGNNMPAGFPAAYDLDAVAFSNKYDAFSAASETTTATNKKTVANNAVYKETMELMDDGKTIGQNDISFTKLFTWSDLKLIVSPPGAASLKVDAKDKVDLTPIMGLVVAMQQAGGALITVTADPVTGVGKESGIDAGVYKGTGKAPGYKDTPFVKEVNVGVDARFTFLMEKV